jgi:hypothetical protein
MVHQRDRVVTYTDEVRLEASEVREGDLLFGLRVLHVDATNQWVVNIVANNGTDSEEATAGIAMDVTKDWPLTVTRLMVLGEDQCIVCKRHGIKYAAQHKCNACYQRERRHGLRAS